MCAELIEDFEGKLGQGFMSADMLEEVNIGSGIKPRPTFVETHKRIYLQYTISV